MVKTNKFFLINLLLCTTAFVLAEDKNSVMLGKYDVKAKLGILVYEEHFAAENLQTLRTDFNDSIGCFRHKFSLSLNADLGGKHYGKPVAEMLARLTHYSFWQRENAYMPMSEETLKFADLDNARLGNHSHQNLVSNIFLEDAWVKVNFDSFVKVLNKYPTFFKAGFFDYQVGRGLSLGGYHDGGLVYLGWDFLGSSGSRSIGQSPVGFMLNTKPAKDWSLDFYFTKWNEYSASIGDTNLPTRAIRISGPRPYRGKNRDRDSYVFKANYEKKQTKYGDLLVEPYFVFTRSPEQSVELVADASAKIYTPGFMVDYKYKNWNVNLELAGQVGRQNIHAIDRNDIKLKCDPTTGVVSEVYTQIYFGASQTVNAPVTDTLNDIINLPTNRTADRNGMEILGAPGYFNAGGIDGFTTANRIRNGSKLNYQSLLAVIDASYSFDKCPVKVAGAAGYIGGDSYPYNDERNKNFKGFITMRDYAYWGGMVKSFGLIFMRYMPRPVGISYSKFYAYSSVRDTANLQYLGLSATVFPYKDRKKSCIMANLLWFWEVGNMKKWDKNADTTSLPAHAYIEARQEKYSFNGWTVDQNASKFLCTEFNLFADYNILECLRLYANGFVIFPGKLLKDIYGQPNMSTIRANPDPSKQTELVYDTLGHSTAYGLNLGIRLDF